MITEIFGERFEELFAEKKQDHETVAKALGIDLSLVYKYLRKEYIPSTSTAIKISDYFECSLSYLFGLSDDTSQRKIRTVSDFKTKFQTLSTEKHYTRYRLKKETTFAKQTIEDWYHGKCLPSIDNLIVLAKFFDCTIDELLGRE